VLFAGDAGGFVNAVTAEGIYYAMVSGELAGRAVADTWQAPHPGAMGQAYDRLWKAELGSELSDAVLVQRYLFANHERVARVVRAASRLPALTDMVVEYTKGRLSYPTLRRRMLMTFPMTIARMVRDRLFGRATGVPA
jgi:flavin-dependent dehydrogenase